MTNIQGVSKKVAPKTFWNSFTSVISFCMKFCKFVGNSHSHISAIFCTFILKFHQMALIFPRVPIFTVSIFEYSIECRHFVSEDLARKPSFPVTPRQRVEVEHC